jgi:hypothetical protein
LIYTPPVRRPLIVTEILQKIMIQQQQEDNSLLHVNINS